MVDWESVEREYRAGILTLRQIADQHGITHGAINKRAKKEGWSRDLAAKIKAKADALVSKQAVSSEVSRQRADTERAIIEANAEMQAGIILAHRSDIRRNRELVSKLVAEVEAITDEPELIERLAEIAGESAEKQAVDLLRRVTSLPSRVTSVKQLVESLKTLVAMEREAFGIDGKRGSGQTLEDFLDSIAGEAG